MENIAIQTSQNIAIEQTLASVGERIVATAIDYAFYIIYFIILSIFKGSNGMSVALAILIIPVVFYHLISESTMNGQSWGKKIMKIKVVKIDGTEANFGSYFIRWIFRLVDITMFFGAVSTLVIILNGKGQRLGDIAANTTVIRLKDKFLTDTIYTKLPDDYILVHSQVNKLTDSDVYTIREVLNFLKKSGHSPASVNMVDKAKSALETKMGIQSEMQSEKFLTTIMHDYNYFHTR
jgi:uncharacterized RDD family membrane protein YckC